RAAERHPALPAVHAAVDRDVGDVDDVGVLRVHCDLLEIPAPSPERRIARQLGPGRAGVVGAEHAALALRVGPEARGPGACGGRRVFQRQAYTTRGLDGSIATSTAPTPSPL